MEAENRATSDNLLFTQMLETAQAQGTPAPPSLADAPSRKEFLVIRGKRQAEG